MAVLLGGLVGSAAVALPHVAGGRPSQLGGDYWVLYSAARVVAHGMDPYRQVVLAAVERRVWPGTPPPPAAANFAYLPIVAWLLGPLARLPFWTSFVVVTVAAVGLTVLAVEALARRLGWRRPLVPALVAVLLWVSGWSLLLGQPDGLLLAVLVGSLLLSLDGHGLAAGLLLTLGWWKPQLLLPAAPLLACSCWPDRGQAARVLLGFIGGSVAGFALQLALLPGLLGGWWRYLHTFAGAVPRLQGDLAGAIGLVQDLPRGLRPAGLTTAWGPGLAAAGALLAVLVAVVAARRRGRVPARADPEARVLAVLVPLAIWLLFTPYDHLEDLLLLVPLVLVVVGRDGVGLGRPRAWVALSLLVALPYVQSLLDGRPNLAPFVAIAAAVAGARALVLAEPRTRAAAAAGTIAPDVPLPPRGSSP